MARTIVADRGWGAGGVAPCGPGRVFRGTIATRRCVERLLVILCLAWTGTGAGAPTEVVLDDDAVVPIETFAAEGRHLLLWLPSEHGHPPAVSRLATELAAQGLEVWVADLLAAYFQPTTPSGLAEVPADAVAALITHAGEQTGKRVFLAANDRGAALALDAARLWRETHAQSRMLGGLVLISPYLLTGTPDVGQDARYLPLVHAAPGPLFILQPALSPGRWQLRALLEALGEGGTSVYARSLPGVRDRFFFRPDADAAEARLAQRLPQEIARAVRLLARTAAPPNRALAPDIPPPPEPPADRGRGLTPFLGDPDPPALSLHDLQGRTQSLSDYRGHVVLVNFWASWCPPCVHEMPSMQRLKEHYADRAFTILAVNMGETRETIEAFLPRVDTDFAILLDRDGQALQRWKVFAFPTSYVIGRGGKIRYALYGAVDWMAPEQLRIFDRLLAEPAP